MANFILCSHCGISYDVQNSVNFEHIDGTCGPSSAAGFCDICGGGNSDGAVVYANGENSHVNPLYCVRFLRETLTYVEQHNLEHDTRYCELEKAVQEITEGRKAALAESRTLKAIRENTDE